MAGGEEQPSQAQLLVTACTSSDWKQIEETDGVAIFEQPSEVGDGTLHLKGVRRISHPVSVVAAAAWDLDKRGTWDELFSTAPETQSQSATSRSTVCHVKLRVHFIDDRELRLQEEMEVTNTRAVLSYLSQPDAPPAAAGLVRAEAYPSGLVIDADPPGGDKPGCTASYVVHINFSGSLPAVAVKTYLSRMLTGLTKFTESLNPPPAAEGNTPGGDNKEASTADKPAEESSSFSPFSSILAAAATAQAAAAAAAAQAAATAASAADSVAATAEGAAQSVKGTVGGAVDGAAAAAGEAANSVGGATGGISAAAGGLSAAAGGAAAAASDAASGLFGRVTKLFGSDAPAESPAPAPAEAAAEPAATSEPAATEAAAPAPAQ